MSTINRENRYLVLKRSDVAELSYNWQVVLERLLDELGHTRAMRGKRETEGGISCVVIEHDWPEYEPVWKMLEQRITNGH